MEKKGLLQANIILAAALAMAGALFLCAYRWDNKYGEREGQPYVLAEQWEYYPGQLYEPEDFAEGGEGLTPEIILIGQTGTFSGAGNAESPFGKATYRKVFHLQESEEGWLLELPEIYTSCRVFVNGALVRSYGSLENAAPKSQVQNTLLSLPPGTVELVIQAANYTHYYSGLTYPPLLGESGVMQETVTARLIFYGVLCFFSLGCAAAFLSLWMGRGGGKLSLSYGLLCLFFAFRSSYPFWHWLGVSVGELLYVAEDTAYFAMVLCMVQITGLLAEGTLPSWISRAARAGAGAMLLFPAATAFLLFPAFPGTVWIYGKWIGIFKGLASLYLIGGGAAALYKGKKPVWLLGGSGVFALGIAADAITAGSFEPVRFGWLDEYSGFGMVLLFTTMMVRSGRHLMKENKALTENLRQEVEKKTAYLERMLEERRQFLAAAAHDLKAPVSVIQTYIDYIRVSGIEVDQEMERYLAVIDRKSAQIQENLQALQQFNAADGVREPLALLDCNTFLRHVYRETQAYAYASGIYYGLILPESSMTIQVREKQLFRALENIILNSVEHTRAYGRITLEAACRKEGCEIKITDNGEGIGEKLLPHVFDYQFSTKSSPGVKGLGLYFVKKTVEEYGGKIRAESEEGKYTAFTILFPADTGRK